MHSLRYLLVLSCVGVLAACGDSSPLQGFEAGPCHPDGTCNTGLVCLSGLCVDPEICTPGDIDPCMCDNGNFGVQTCDSGGDWGACVCSPDCGDGDCTGDENHATCPQDCPPETCGDGTIDAGEDCDGTNLDGSSCEDQGYVGGVLACGTTCLYDLSSCTDAEYITFEGIVWSPGADEPVTHVSNRFPVPGALVIAHSAPPALPPQGVYCNTCADEQPTDPYTISDPQDGSFSLSLEVGASYWLTVRKGAFQRTRLLVVPNTLGDSFTLEESTASLPRPSETTLPHGTDWPSGDHIPHIAVFESMYQDEDLFLGALGFDMVEDVVLLTTNDIQLLVEDASALSQFNVLLAFSSDSYPMGSTAASNLRDWVQAGGTLFADDWAADFVEQPWPEFLTWYNNGVCGDGPTPPATEGECNASPSYDFLGAAVPTNFAVWLSLPTVHDGGPLTFDYAWNLIYEVHPGVVGEDAIHNPIQQAPDVWILNTDSTPAGQGLPAIVSWPYYCGRVIYSLPITGQANPVQPYILTLQEKVFYYLLFGADGC